MLVGGDLHLDVAGGLDQLLQVDPVVAERGARLAAGQAEQALELVVVVDALDAPAPSAARRLDQQRVADLAWRARAPASALATSPPGRTGAPALAASSRAASLSPASFIALAGGPDEGQAVLPRALGERGLSERKP